MKVKALREKTVAELISERDKLRKTYNELRFKKVVSVVENPLQLRVIRRNIAAILTVLHERELKRLKEEINKLEK
ncbi:MAG TPA: 50S ribosomal protein L29 [Spirochaetota bacterium]|nr:50S ribosomal protein L29 [Spirochaetota bacterium]HOS33794.1 50S ribosomal protein L29 [Spirochaetota bacterium]HOS55060.1 50S ribosomal protein L29 [Spirochaetota bacterium]HQF77700.1 50S ribosomal protein L29 [Spirochaetota bacterium]HQH30722.1 50S ribosomal protein L29 [Spirochaetota bacterium]